jgi:large subunit ribosomal protein L4e
MEKEKKPHRKTSEKKKEIRIPPKTRSAAPKIETPEKKVARAVKVERLETTEVKKKGEKKKELAVEKKKEIKIKTKTEKKLRKIHVYSIDGEIKKNIELPTVFTEEVRTDIIRRAVKVIQANRRQPYGPTLMSGKRHSVETWGKGRGVSRVKRLMGQFRGAFSPGTVGGRRSHPPRVEENLIEKINKKERIKAKHSALSAVANANFINERGHRFNTELTLPVVIENEFENLNTTKKVIDTLENLGVYEDIVRTIEGTHIRAGRGKRRGRRYHVPKSILLVVSKFGGIEKGSRNLPGVDITTPQQLNLEHLAPGGSPGRLTIFTESAISQLRR